MNIMQTTYGIEKTFSSHIKKAKRSGINFNNVFYLTQHSPSIIISTWNQCTELLKRCFTFFFSSLHNESLKSGVCCYTYSTSQFIQLSPISRAQEPPVAWPIVYCSAQVKNLPLQEKHTYTSNVVQGPKFIAASARLCPRLNGITFFRGSEDQRKEVPSGKRNGTDHVPLPTFPDRLPHDKRPVGLTLRTESRNQIP